MPVADTFLLERPGHQAHVRLRGAGKGNPQALPGRAEEEVDVNHYTYHYDCGCPGALESLCPTHGRPIQKAGVVFDAEAASIGPAPLSHSWPNLAKPASEADALE
jgi:hypothetical protein